MSTKELHFGRVTRLPKPPSSEWKSILSLAPSALATFPARDIARQSLDLISNGTNNGRFMSVLRGAQADLRAARVPILVNQHRAHRLIVPPRDLKRPKRHWLGQLALELYFGQLFRRDSAVLDLSPSRLGVADAGDAVWCPRPLYVQWDPDFLQGVRDLYAGFFLGDDQRFGLGIKQLGLGSAGGLLLQHLGEDNQRGVRFSVAKLQSTLREISAARTKEDGALHRNTIAFGLYVASLHELLESLELAFDVRRAFMRTHRGQMASDASIGKS
jgi:hypothetical protein